MGQKAIITSLAIALASNSYCLKLKKNFILGAPQRGNGQVCNTLRVGLAYGALASQGSRQGRYQLSGTINGKPSWESSTQAIWYIPQFQDWGIGSKYDKGGLYRGLATGTGGYQGEFYPNELPFNMWYYWTGSYWSSQFNDIVIECEGNNVN